MWAIGLMQPWIYILKNGTSNICHNLEPLNRLTSVQHEYQLNVVTVSISLPKEEHTGSSPYCSEWLSLLLYKFLHFSDY